LYTCTRLKHCLASAQDPIVIVLDSADWIIMPFQHPVGCWDKSENKYTEYAEVVTELQADLVPNARTEEELAAIDFR
jgi:murein tripeptide amidase MpaA